MVEVIGEPIILKREFKTLDDFNLYYDCHRDEFKNKKSLRLNKEFKIDGYRISTAKCNIESGEIKLVKNKVKNKIDVQVKLKELESKIKILTDSVAQIIDTINSLNA
ncbi:MAG: hypothetical protein IJZ77_04165 [Bacilli bacterium]|nr:hypothetical protein [Bacilli bacterium]